MSIRHPFLAVSYLVLLGTGAFGSRSFLPKTDPSSPTSRRLNEYGDYDYDDYGDYGDYSYYSSAPSPSYAPGPSSLDYCDSAGGGSCFAIPDEGLSILAADLANVIYKNSTDPVLESRITGQLGAVSFKFITDNTTGTEAILIDSDGPFFLAFRGTNSGQDWMTNLGLMSGDDNIMDVINEVYLGEYTANMHDGYVRAFDSVYTDIVETINGLDPDAYKNIVVVGHSLGGALATVAAAMLQANSSFPHSIKAVFTFGSPRVGDASWVDAYNNLGLWDKTYRYANQWDPVAAVPQASSGFYHVGKPVIINEDYDQCTEITSSADFNSDTDFCAERSWVELGLCSVATVLTTAVATPFCLSDAFLSAPGESSLCGVAFGLLAGNQACCAYKVHVDKNYHSMGVYVESIKNLCISDCGYKQFEECGGDYGLSSGEDDEYDYDYDYYSYAPAPAPY